MHLIKLTILSIRCLLLSLVVVLTFAQMIVSVVVLTFGNSIDFQRSVSTSAVLMVAV